MALNRDQEDQIALEFRHTLEEVLGSEIEPTAWVRFKEFEGNGHGIVLKNDCGQRAYEARRMRGEGLEFRAALQNGCKEEARRVGELFRKKLKKLAASWGRQGLVVKYWGVEVDPAGVATDQPYVMPPLDKGG